MALRGTAGVDRAGYFVLYGSGAVLILALLVAYLAPAWQGRLNGYPSHPLGWYGWALIPFGIAVQLLLLRTLGGLGEGGRLRWLIASVLTAIWLGSLLLLHTSVWRLIDDHRDFASGSVIVTQQRLPISWASHYSTKDRMKRSVDHYSAYTPRLKDALYLEKPDFDRLRAGRADTLRARLPVNGRWCFSLRLEQGGRGAVRIVGKLDGRLPPGSVVPCGPGEDRA